MLLSEDHLAIRDAVRDFVVAEIAPHAAAWDRDAIFPREALQGLAALGCYGVAVPTEWDGAGLDYLALAVILEEIAAGDGATSTIVSVNNCPVCSILMAWASEAQKERWLKPLARGEMLGAFCLTEPHVGSQADGAEDHCPPRRRQERRPLRHRRHQAVHHQRQERRRRDRHGGHRQGRRQARHQRLRRADLDAGLPRRERREASSASTRATPRRSSSRTAACRPTTGSARKGRA